MPEKLLKLEKEREELKIHRRSCAIDFISDTSTPYKKDSNNQIISPTSTNISTIQCRKGNQLIQRDVSRMFASAEGNIGSHDTKSKCLFQILKDPYYLCHLLIKAYKSAINH